MMPVVDIFAGAGGLSEGFARAGFKIALSCEKEETFCETLKIRHFVNNFNKKNIPKDYYDFLKGKISLDELTTKFPKEFKNSSKSVICHTMGRKSNKLCCPIFAKAWVAASLFNSIVCNSVTILVISASSN